MNNNWDSRSHLDSNEEVITYGQYGGPQSARLASRNQGYESNEELEEHSNQALIPERDRLSMASNNGRANTSSEIVVHVEPQRPEIESYNSDDSSIDEDWRNPENELKQSLPSHSFKAVRGLPSGNAYKKGNIRQSLRGKSPRLGASSRGSDVDDEVQSVQNDVFNENEGLGDFTPQEFSELVRRRKSLKEISTTMQRKRTIREKVTESAIQRNDPRHISTWTHFKLSFAMGWQHFKDSCKELLYSLDLWKGHLKLVQGMFGSGVLAYFVLLRWLFLLNVVIFLLTILFLFIPQMVFKPSYKTNNESFSGWDLLTGEGWFVKTELYYGQYTNETISTNGGKASYNMPLAYLCVGGGYLLLCLAILVYSMAESYRRNYIYSGDNFSFFVAKVFCSWDYGITDKPAAMLKQKSVFNDLQETIAEHQEREQRSLGDKCSLFFLRLITNFIVTSLIGGAAFLINFSSQQSLEDEAKVLKKLLLPLVVTAANFILPMAFRVIASLERYENPRTVVTVNLARTIVLKLASLVMILVSLYVDIVNCRETKESESEKCAPAIRTCWENYVGFAFYRLMIVDFVFLLLSAFFGEFVRRILAVNVDWCKAKMGPPGFDISRNVLDLVYAQALCWIGTFFSPLLSVANLIKLWILFYVKTYSVTKNCRPSVRPFRAAKMNLLFLFLLGISFLVALVTIGYTVMSDEVTFPSKQCGPFRDQNAMYDIIKETVEMFPNWLGKAVSYISSASFLAMLFCILGIVVYYYKMLKDSNEKKIKLLKLQIAIAGRDKLYLIKRIKQGMTMNGVNHTD